MVKSGTTTRKFCKNTKLEYPKIIRPSNKTGRMAQLKSCNLLVRLRDYEDNSLRFMTRKDVPLTNNLTGNSLRMIKVQQ
ncbi:MAG: transposase [Candidatus Adiutrix intracellularis]|nr:transposase [Candidatus Adiutrix intracellularis]